MRSNLGGLVVIPLVALGLCGCGPAAEEPVLAQFFAAARLADHTAVARLSTVAFEPQVDGIVAQFAIINATPERPTAPLADVVQLSTAGTQASRDGQPDVEVVSKDLTIDAQVRMFDGRTVQKTLMVTLQRAVSKGDKVAGRWIVTGIASGT